MKESKTQIYPYLNDLQSTQKLLAGYFELHPGTIVNCIGQNMKDIKRLTMSPAKTIAQNSPSSETTKPDRA